MDTNVTNNLSDGYSYELWSAGTGTGSMTVFDVNAEFSATWSGVGDFLARAGLAFNETETPSQIGTISANFSETKSGTAGFSYIGIYGWMVSPLTEYYIVDDWFGSRPSTASLSGNGTTATLVGTFTTDGGTYDVYSHTQPDQPNITGTNQNFEQIFSVRQTARQCGTITISNHFSEWSTLGLSLGKLEEARILVEAGGSATGNIDFTTATVTTQ